MALIFLGSTDVLSAEHTSRFIGPFLRWLDPHLSGAAIEQVQFFVRKAGHVTEYAVLAALLVRAAVNVLWPQKMLGSATAVFLLSAAFAASDEFHQRFVPTRTASPRDVAIDCAGALGGIAIYAMFRSWRTNVSQRALPTGSGPERI